VQCQTCAASARTKAGASTRTKLHRTALGLPLDEDGTFARELPRPIQMPPRAWTFMLYQASSSELANDQTVMSTLLAGRDVEA